MKKNFEMAVGRRLAAFFPQGVVHTLTSSLIVFPSLSFLMIPRFSFGGASSSFLTSRQCDWGGGFLRSPIRPRPGPRSMYV